MEKQYALKYNDAVFCFAPCLRLLQDGEENSKRHLYTFTQVEVEKKNADADEMRRVHEKVCKNVANELLTSPLTARIDIRNIEALLTTPYRTYSFCDVKSAASKAMDDDSLKDLSLEEEIKFAASNNLPAWIKDYPLKVRDSLYHEYQPGVLETFDLILPFGFGEVTTGGQRVVSGEEAESQARILDARINSELEMYIAFKKNVNIKSAGFGIGLERLIRYICGAESIFDVVSPHIQGPNRGIVSNTTRGEHNEDTWKRGQIKEMPIWTGSDGAI